MHTVGREETEKGLTPYDSAPVAETDKQGAKPLPRPRRKKASKALKSINEKIGKKMSLEKLESKDILGRHVGVRNGFRGVIVSEALIGLDACQDILNEMRCAVSDEPDVDRKIRAARAAGELVGQLSSLIGQASEIQKQINEEQAPKSKRSSAPPIFAIHNHNGQAVSEPANSFLEEESLDQSQDQSLQPMDSSSSEMPNHQDEPRNTEAGSSTLGSPTPALSQERSRPLLPADISQDDTDNTTSHEQPQPSHEAPPWEEKDEEF